MGITIYKEIVLPATATASSASTTMYALCALEGTISVDRPAYPAPGSAQSVSTTKFAELAVWATTSQSIGAAFSAQISAGPAPATLPVPAAPLATTLSPITLAVCPASNPALLAPPAPTATAVPLPPTWFTMPTTPSGPASPAPQTASPAKTSTAASVAATGTI